MNGTMLGIQVTCAIVTATLFFTNIGRKRNGLAILCAAGFIAAVGLSALTAPRVFASSKTPCKHIISNAEGFVQCA